MATREQSGTNIDAWLLRSAGVYEIRNAINGRRYVGSSIRLDRRHHEHFKRLRAGTHTNPGLQFAWSKYGAGALEFRVLAILEPAEVQPTEQRLLDSARLAGERLYNVAVDVTSGMKGRSHSVETRQLLSVKHTAYFADAQVRAAHCTMKAEHGKRPETRRRMSDAGKKRLLDEDVRLAHEERTRAILSTPEAREKHRKAVELALAADPLRPVRQAATLRNFYTEERRAEQAARMRAFYQTPEGLDCLARMTAKKRGVKNTPESNEKRRQTLLAKRGGQHG